MACGPFLQSVASYQTNPTFAGFRCCMRTACHVQSAGVRAPYCTHLFMNLEECHCAGSKRSTNTCINKAHVSHIMSRFPPVLAFTGTAPDWRERPATA